MGMMNLRVTIGYFVTPLETWHRYTDGLRNFCNLYSRNILYHLRICPVTTAIHTTYPQYLIPPYCLPGHNSYTHQIPTIPDITLLSVRSQQLYTPYTQNIWYHLTICPVTKAIHTIYPQYMISTYYLSGHNSYTHHIPTISDITLLSVRSQQLYTPYTHNTWYHLTVCPVTTAIHTINWHKRFEFGSPVFIYDGEGHSFWISLRKWLVTFLNTSLPLPSDIPIDW
jgi:hypothetical protein